MPALLVTVVLALAFAGSAHPAVPRLRVQATFYSSYEHLEISYYVGSDPACATFEYGSDSAGCYDLIRNAAHYDVRVYQTGRSIVDGRYVPTLLAVYSTRSTGINGQADKNLYWSFHLKAPHCARRPPPWIRRYEAVVRLFSPVDGRVLRTTSTDFELRCN